MNVGVQRSSEKHVSLSLFVIIQLFVVCKKSNLKRAELPLAKTGLIS